MCAVFRINTGERYLYVSRTNRIYRLRGRLNSCPAAQVPMIVDREILPRGPFSSVEAHADGCDGSSAKFEGMRKSVIFELTQQCNLRCDYCVYSGNYRNMRSHGQKTMTWEDLKTGMDRFAYDSRKLKACEISFYGGETLLEFELLKKSIAYARGCFPGRTLSFSVSTNGILLTPDKMLWLGENPDVSVMITVNGPFHDQWRHRADGLGSLNEILRHLDWAKTHVPGVWERQLDFICNIASLKQVGPLREFYRRVIGKCPKIITCIDRDRGNDFVRRLLGEEGGDGLEQSLFAEYKRTGDDFLHVLFGLPLSEIHDRKLYPADAPGVSRTCMPFLNRMFVSADGRLDFCERVGTLAFGTIQGGIDQTAVAEAERSFVSLLNRKCRFCWAQRLCSLCYKDVEGMSGDNPTVPEKFCIGVKRRTLEKLKEYCEVAVCHPEIYKRIDDLSKMVRARRPPQDA